MSRLSVRRAALATTAAVTAVAVWGAVMPAQALALVAPDSAARSDRVTDPTSARVQLDPMADPAPGVGLSVAVSAVPATSTELDAAEAERDRLVERRSVATAALAASGAELLTVDRDRASLRAVLERRDGQILKADATGQQLREDLRAVAVEWFITGFDATKVLDPTLSSEERDQLSRGRVLATSAAEDTIADERYASSRLESLREDRERLDRQRVELDQRSTDLMDRGAELGAELDTLARTLDRTESRIAETRMTATIDGTDMSTGALDAYWRAARTLAVTDPRCRVTWWALAGIGRTESRHGTYRGASVGRDGRVTPPIYGPDLDGSNTFAIVPDSDGGQLDGTSATDRAVGPMQFLPGTWAAMGRDGTGDGVDDPQNLYDAALSAGAYLCRSGPDLLDESRLRAAYLTYNRSQEYVEVVLGHARNYEATVPLPSS